MIDKRLVGTVGESKRYIVGNVAFQWVSLCANITLMTAVSRLLVGLFTGNGGSVAGAAVASAAALMVRFVCAIGAARMGYLSGKAVKKTLRELIYKKLLRLGASYKEQTQTSEVVQIAVEGVEQLETYFGAYLPQFFYAVLAPLTLFGYLCFVDVAAASVLLVCVPMIPVAIIAVQRWAKKLLGHYWGEYTALGDSFLENLQGLTTLKIYQSDGVKHKEMNEQAEKFRVITMKVLTMQLNSITIMDFIAYGGAALGMIMAVVRFQAGHVDLGGCLLIILLAADFFLPMRQLGSFFHIAMNGMAASEKIFRLLDLPEREEPTGICPADATILWKQVHFSYETDREILRGVNMVIPQGGFVSIVGESGCGKSTIAGILMGRNQGYTGSVSIGGAELRELSEGSLMENLTYISHQSYLYKGTVRDNLLMGNPHACDQALWAVLEQANLAAFLRSEQGLETKLTSRGENLSGGQRQRLALARALLHDSPVYIFDEATSNIDVESENDIMERIHELAKNKTVILISHRLANVTGSDCIYVMEQGMVTEQGTHEELLHLNKHYAALWNAQQRLENYGREGM